MNRSVFIILIGLICLLSKQASGQRGHGSIYSSYGLGLPSYDNFGMAKRLGGVGAAVRSPYFLNSVNPASESGIQTGYTFMVDVDASYNYQVIQTSGASIANNFSNLNHFGFWFKPSQSYTISLGLSPMNTKDYSFSDQVFFEGLSEKYTRIFRGWGNLNKAYINFSTQFGRKFSIGLRPYYLFGNDTKEAIYLNQNVDGFISKDQISLSGAGTDFGFQYLLLQKKNYALIFGATGNVNTKINGNATSTVYTYISNELLYEADDDSDTYQIGPSIRGGLSFQNNKWVVATDYLFAFKSPKVIQSSDNQVISLGVELLPDYTSQIFINRMNYSMGVSYQTGSIELDGIKVPIYSLGASIGIPINIASRVSLGYQYKYTGDAYTVSKESLHSITLNFTFADRWFQRYKYE